MTRTPQAAFAGSFRAPKRRGLAVGLCALVVLALAGFAPRARAHEPLGASLDAVSSEILRAPDDASLRLRRAELRRLAGAFEGAADDLLPAGE